MNIMRIGDLFELTIHTRSENRQRVQECVNASDVMFEARRYGRQASDYTPSAGQSVLLVGVIGAIGRVFTMRSVARDTSTHNRITREIAQPCGAFIRPTEHRWAP